MGSWFRGQAISNWELLPKAGRKTYYLPNNRDLGRFNDWEHQAIAYESLPKNRLEGLALAQHHGLATRLLDWTKNPLVATYFAVCEEPKQDGAVYILDPLEKFVNQSTPFENIGEYEGVVCFIPRAISTRVLNQQGMFTIHCPANHEIEVAKSRVNDTERNLIKLIIKNSMKKEVEKMLSDYGINHSSLFPDLDGLSNYKNRYTADMVRRRST